MKEHHKKIVSLSSLSSDHKMPDWQGATVCFGHFNVIHPGHLRYFLTARTYGSQLVVAVEGDDLLSDAKRNETYPEFDRALAVASLEVVDTVVILDTGRLGNLIALIKPNSLVLGREFEKSSSDEIKKAIDLTVKFGGEVVYEAGETHYATSGLFSGRQDEIEHNRWKQFQSALENWEINLDTLFSRLKTNKNLNLLVMGDTILDQYVACDPMGMSNEAPVVVVKELETRDFIGGAAIVAAHVASLGANCTYLSVVGKDMHGQTIRKKLEELHVTTELINDASRPTTSKLRYMVENQKLFRVSRLKEHSLSNALEEVVISKLEKLAPNLDGIIVCDFVYGVITPRIIETLDRVSKEKGIPLFGDLQCSSQVGNITKFRDFCLLCPTEREARIALGNQNDGVEYVANLLMDTTRSRNLLIKLGADGFIAYGKKEHSEFLDRQHFPSLTANPVDVTGAGDSLLAAMSVGFIHGFNLMEAAALGTCMAALSVQTVGNVPITLEELMNYFGQRGASIYAG